MKKYKTKYSIYLPCISPWSCVIISLNDFEFAETFPCTKILCFVHLDDFEFVFYLCQDSGLTKETISYCSGLQWKGIVFAMELPSFFYNLIEILIN